MDETTPDPHASADARGPSGLVAAEAIPTVRVGLIPVADASTATVIEEAARAPAPRPGREPSDEVPATAVISFALHVGGLLHRNDPEFLRALAVADLIYADGAAVVSLARLAGARHITRSATTDIGLPVIELVADRLGRPARLALIGGEPGLAERAAASIVSAGRTEVVFTADGFFTDADPILDGLSQAAPDVVLIGLGMPKEAMWVAAHRERLPAAVVLTCGGWFGFLTGQERRAPQLLQRAGLEWTYRLRQDFGRLAVRYARGALVTAALVPHQLGQRRAARRRAATGS